jgi:hypothetical protein
MKTIRCAGVSEYTWTWSRSAEVPCAAVAGGRDDGCAGAGTDDAGGREGVIGADGGAAGGATGVAGAGAAIDVDGAVPAGDVSAPAGGGDGSGFGAGDGGAAGAVAAGDAGAAGADAGASVEVVARVARDDVGARGAAGAFGSVRAARVVSRSAARGTGDFEGIGTSTFMVVTGSGARTVPERLTSSVTSRAAFTPSTASSTQTHQRGRVAKNIGRATVCTVTAPRSFSSSARLSAS